MLRGAVCTFLLDGVLRGHNNERGWQLVGHRTDGHLLFLHGFKQSCLRLWWSTVDLVSEEEVAEQWTWLEGKFTFLGVVNVGTGDVCWEQVRRELNTLEVTTERIGKGVGHQRLCQSGVIFEQKVSV